MHFLRHIHRKLKTQTFKFIQIFQHYTKLYFKDSVLTLNFWIVILEKITLFSLLKLVEDTGAVFSIYRIEFHTPVPLKLNVAKRSFWPKILAI